MTPHSRATDPETSRDAARTCNAESQRLACYAAVVAHPGKTAAEISDLCGLERHVASRRLPELRDQGLIVTGLARICRLQGRLSMTWHPVHQKELFV